MHGFCGSGDNPVDVVLPRTWLPVRPVAKRALTVADITHDLLRYIITELLHKMTNADSLDSSSAVTH